LDSQKVVDSVSDEEQSGGFTFRDRRGSGEPVKLTPPRSSTPPAASQSEKPSGIWTPPSVKRAAPPAPAAPVAPVAAGDAPVLDVIADVLPESPSTEMMLDPESGIPSVYHVLSEQLMMMQQIAVVRLGLAPDPMTHLPAQNLREARVAVEVLTKIVQEMTPVLRPEEVGQIGQLVRELRARYTEAVAQATEQN
jgi:hypothetical protein